MNEVNTQESSRKHREAEYWDRQVFTEGGGFRDHLYSAVNEHLWKQILRELGDLKDKRVLFVGCGITSSVTREIASREADVWCVDISPDSINKLMGHPYGALKERIHPVVADAEDMPLDDGSIDVVLGKAIVHHLDIGRFMAELRRICVPGARIVFSEPLAANPLIKLFRWLTPGTRIPTEHPLTRKDLRSIAGYCTKLKKRYNYVLALVSIPFFMLGCKKMGIFLFRLGCVLDRALLGVFPPARILGWNVTLVGDLNSKNR